MATDLDEELKEMTTEREKLETLVHRGITQIADLLKVEKGEEFEIARRIANVEIEKHNLTKTTELFNDIVRRATNAFKKKSTELVTVSGVITGNLQAVVEHQKQYNAMAPKDRNLELLSETLEKALKAAGDATIEERAGKSKASKKVKN